MNFHVIYVVLVLQIPILIASSVNGLPLTQFLIQAS